MFSHPHPNPKRFLSSVFTIAIIFVFSLALSQWGIPSAFVGKAVGISTAGGGGAGGCDGGGNCYVRAGATGSGNGSSWTNACTGFTGACSVAVSAARGVTFWVARGSYASVDFSAPDSGTAAVTIIGTTIANHGPASDWVTSYAGEALFDGDNTISTDYWIFNGQTRGADWTSGYTLHFKNATDGQGFALGTWSAEATYHDWNISYVNIEGTHIRSNTFEDRGFQCYSKCNDIYIGYSYLHHAGSDLVGMNWGDNNGTNHTFEYDYFAYNDYARSSPGGSREHSQAVMDTGNNVVLRYNVFRDIMNSGVVTDATAGPGPTFSNREFYGNIIFWDSAFAADPEVFLGGNGILGFFGENFSGHIYFYNNTIVGVSTMNVCHINALGGGAGEQVYNNIWEHTANCTSNDMGSTVDYNAYGADSANSNGNGAHDYMTSAELLANWTSYTLAGFRPATPDPFSGHAGLSLPAPYNTDLNGTMRRAGAWARGAYEFGGTTSTITIPTTKTTPAVTHSGSLIRNLGLGSRGPDVTLLQQLLIKDHDYPEARVTGYYGFLTQRAVQRFQRKYGIVIDGTPATTGYGSVGPRTRGRMNSAQ